MAARQLTLSADAWRRHPVSVTEASAAQLTMTGPVTIHANLSDTPMRVSGPALSTFGDVEATADELLLHPDAVVLVNSAAANPGHATTKEER